MIETEAAKKWCPMVRYTPTDSNLIGKTTDTRPWANCRGAACALWVSGTGEFDDTGDFVPSGRCGLVHNP